MSRLFKDSFLVVSSKIISMGLGFFSSVFFIRLIGATGKGSLSVLEAGAALLVLVTTVNLNNGVIHFVAKKKLDNSKILGISILILLFSIFVTFLIVFGSFWAGFSSFLLTDGDFLTYASLLLTMMVILELKEIFSSFLKGLKFFKDLYNSTLIYSFFRLILFASLYFINKKYNFEFSIVQLLLAHIVCLLVLMISTFLYFIKEVKIKPNFKIKLNEIKHFIRFSSVGMLVILLSFFSQKADIWIVDNLLGVEQLGFYSVAVGLSVLILQIPMALRNVLFPYLSSINNTKERIKLLALFSRINTTILIVIVVGLFLLSDVLIPFMYGDDFLPSVYPFKIIIIGVAFLGFKDFFQIYNMSIEKQKHNVISNSIGLLVLLVLDVFLIPEYGIIGASIGALVSYMMSSVFIYYALIKTQDILSNNFVFIAYSDIKKTMAIIKK